MIDQSKARELAEQHLAKQDLRGFSYQFSGVTFSEKWPNEWSVVFNVFSSEKTLIDGPLVLIVDQKTGEVSSM